jgi:hypothetical protein
MSEPAPSKSVRGTDGADDPITPPATVPARRIRHDGWTVARQEAFLTALAACGCITDACRAVGMSRESARRLYNRPGTVAFRRAFDAALDCAGPVVEAGAWERSVKGVARPIFFQGEQVGEYRHYDERLTMFLLRYRRAHRFGAPLDRLPPPPPPRLPPSLEDEGPDPDEALGELDWQLGDLVDEAELAGGLDQSARAHDGANFANFDGNDEDETSQNRHAELDSASIVETNGEGDEMDSETSSG